MLSGTADVHSTINILVLHGQHNMRYKSLKRTEETL